MSSEMTTCPTCGAEMPANGRFCPNCGAANAAAQAPEPVEPVAPAQPVDAEPAVPAEAAAPAEPAAEAQPETEPEPATAATTDFATPLAPPSFYEPIEANDTNGSNSAETTPTPDESMGSPTVNVGTGAEAATAAGASTEEGSPTVYLGSNQDAARYASPAAAAAAYQTGSQPANQGQPQYSPPPTAQAYGGTQNFQQYTPPSQPIQPYSNTPPPATNYQYQSTPAVAGIPMRDPTIALLLELLGYVGFLGIGHMYAGRVSRGIGLLVVWWLYWGIVGVLFATVIGIPVACVMAILWPVVPILSGLWIRSDLLKGNTFGRR